jgi:hypothetical protein
MDELSAADPHRGFLRRTARRLGAAFALAAAAGVGLGLAADRLGRTLRREPFTARGLQAPPGLRAALGSRDPEAIRREVAAHPREALRLLVDRAHGLPGIGDAEHRFLLETAAPAFPVRRLLPEFRKVFRTRMGAPDPAAERMQDAALTILERNDDLAVEEVLGQATLSPSPAIGPRARKLLQAREAPGGIGR